MARRTNRRGIRVAIVRGGEWDCTQAIPRVLDALRLRGLRPVVLCWDKSAKGAPREVIDGTEIVRFRRFIPPRHPAVFLWWTVWWVWILWRLRCGRYDVVHVMDVDTLVPGVIGKWLLRYRLIYDSRDPLGLTLSAFPWPIPQAFTALDRVFCPWADGILLSQGDVAACARFFGRRACQRVPVVQVLNVPKAAPPARWREPTARPLRINLSGYLSPVRGVFVLADALGDRDDIVIDVVGDIRYETIRERYAALRNARLHGRVPLARAMELMDEADLVSILYDPALKTALISSANKMFEAMMLGKPYAAVEGSWYGRIAVRYGLGWALPYGDVQRLRELADRLNAEPSLLAEAGRRGRACYEKHFTWPEQRENLMRLYRRVLGEDDPAPARAKAGWSHFLGSLFT